MHAGDEPETVSPSDKMTTAREQAEAEGNRDALSRLRRVYSFLNMTNEAIARIGEPEPLFDEACRIAVEVGGFRMAWIGLVDEKTGQIKPVAHRGFEDGYLEKIFVSAHGSDQQGQGPTGTAARTGEINICKDFESDPRMTPWRGEAMKRGYCSSGAFPLRVGDRIVGVMTLYASEKDFFSDEEIALFKSLAENISMAIDAMEKERLHAIAEDELALRAELLDAATDSIFVHDADGNFIYVNEAGWNTRGYSREEFLSMNLRELATPKFSTLLADRMSQAERFGHAMCESAHICKDGSVIPVEVHIKAIEDRERVLFLSVVRDITERKKVEKELEEYREHLEELVEQRTLHLQALNRELESFSYSVSHDLRSPVRVIDMTSRMLLEDSGDRLDEEERKSFAVIFRNIERIDDIIEGLLRLARAGSRELQVSEVDVGAMAEDVIQELKPDLSGREVQFVVGELPSVSCDEVLMRQVFVNLISNAVKFTSDCGDAVIEVRGERIDEETVYAVSDNGIGFDPGQADRLFGVFQRLHGHERFGGTGVGLALVQRIIQRHGGRVWAEGATGEGATFYLALPCALAQGSG